MTRPEPLPETAEVVVVGGGAVGASIAFHLAEAGVASVVLVERGELGSGSTGKAAGGVRAQFSTPVNVELSRRSLECFEEFGRRPGWEIDFARIGYLFLLSSEEAVEEFRENVRMQNEFGVPSEMVSPQRAGELSPIISPEGVLAASYCPTDGRLTPDAVVQGYAAGARAHGATVIRNCAVTGIVAGAGGIAAVETARGTIATEHVICAAGAWSPSIGAMVGVELPVTAVRQQLLFTEQIADLPPRLPLTIDFDTGFYFHQEGQALLFGMADSDEPPSYRLETSDEWLAPLMEVVERRVPSVAGAGIRGSWAGLYELTDDHNPIVGESGTVPGFVYATGFSGHGVMHAPAIGEAVRDLLLSRLPEFDLAGFALERFLTGASRAERSVI